MLMRPISIRVNMGFTLIELMIVVGIVAILAAITIPSYQESIKRARRVDAMTDLQSVVSRMESFYSTDSANTYTTNSTLVGIIGGKTAGGYYSIAITNDPCGDITQCYRITATAVAGTTQADDTDCTTLTIDSTGVTTPAVCWRR